MNSISTVRLSDGSTKTDPIHIGALTDDVIYTKKYKEESEKTLTEIIDDLQDGGFVWEIE